MRLRSTRMSNDGLISIVVPVYAVEEYLPQCVDSLLSQRYKNLEIILVDDGSADKCAEICDRYALADRRIRVVHKTNGGLVSARKAGVALATGQYLGFVDGDDWVASDYFEFLHEHAASTSADLVISGHIREFFGKCEAIKPRSAAGFYSREGVLETLLPSAIYNGVFFQHGVSTYVWNKLFRREKAARFVASIDDEIVMGEDAALTYPYLAAADSVVVCGPGNYFYRQRSNSIVKSVPSIQKEYYQLSVLFRYLKRMFEGAAYSDSVFNQLRYYFYAQVLVRSGAVVGGGSPCVIPFPKLALGQRIVVYSSGSFGQHAVAALRRLDRYDLVGWVDDDDDESQRSGLPVTSVDSISALDFDLVLIAAIDSQYADAVAGRLEDRGVDRARISLLTVDFPRLEECLGEIGFDMESFAFSAP
jgi:glycosyltransferase involved in cell wall biosynthesis